MKILVNHSFFILLFNFLPSIFRQSSTVEKEIENLRGHRRRYINYLPCINPLTVPTRYFCSVIVMPYLPNLFFKNTND